MYGLFDKQPKLIPT